MAEAVRKLLIRPGTKTGQILTQLRKEFGFTQGELGIALGEDSKLRNGWTASCISMCESGERHISKKMAAALDKIFAVNIFTPRCNGAREANSMAAANKKIDLKFRTSFPKGIDRVLLGYVKYSPVLPFYVEVAIVQKPKPKTEFRVAVRVYSLADGACESEYLSKPRKTRAAAVKVADTMVFRIRFGLEPVAPKDMPCELGPPISDGAFVFLW